LAAGGLFESRPDREGIKTTEGKGSEGKGAEFESRPDREGIKTKMWIGAEMIVSV